MTKKIFHNFDTQKAEKSPAYMIDWKAERAQTNRIIQFILRILKLNNICRGTITKRAGMGNGQIGRILDTDQQKQLRAEFIAAFGSFGQYLVEELKDIDEAMKVCNDIYQSYTNL